MYARLLAQSRRSRLFSPLSPVFLNYSASNSWNISSSSYSATIHESLVEGSKFVESGHGAADDPLSNGVLPTTTSILQPPPIPPLPERVTGYPTPHVTNEDLRTYVEPLYSLYWGIIFPIKYNSGPSPTVAQLERMFKFNDFATAVAFIQDVAAIAKSENHHPALKLEGDRVTFTTVTHCGRPPLTSAANLMGNDMVPSLTIRDVRLAILAETLFRDTYVAGKRGKNPVGEIAPKTQRPSSLEEMEATNNRLRNSRPASPIQSRPQKCPCCQGPHFLRSCPDRKTTNPPYNCRLCGQFHWIVDCPVLVPKHQ